MVQGLAALAADWFVEVLAQGGVDLFSERLAERPRGGPCGVAVQGERRRCGGEADLVLAVGEGVDERESDDVRFGGG